MQISVETTSELGRRIKVEVPANRVDDEVESKAKEYAKTIRLDGFRPGKVPLRVVKSRFGSVLRAEVINDVVTKSLHEALVEQDLRPAGMPDLQLDKTLEGQPLAFSATFDVYPEITLADFSGFSLETPETTIGENDVDDTIEKMRGQFAEWKVVDRAAKDGDKVTIDFVGKMDGEVFPGGSSTDHELQLGTNSMIAGFESGIVGAKPNDTRMLELNFPEDYFKDDLQGKPVQFEVTVKQVMESELPEVNDSFAERFGIAEGGLAKLREDITTNLNAEVTRLVKDRVNEQISTCLLENHEFEMPAALIKEEQSRLQLQALRMSGQNKEPSMDDLSKLPEDLFKDEAIKRVRLSLLFMQVIRDHKIDADKDRVKAYIDELAAAYQDPEQVRTWYYGDQERLAQVEAVILEEQVADLILKSATVKNTTMSFEDLVNKKGV